EAARRRHRHQHAYLRAAARLAEDGDVGGIASERRDIVAHPFERRHDIEHPGDARRWERFAAAKLIEMQVAEGVEAMVDRHDDYIAPAGEIGAVVPWRRAGTGDERAAVAPEHHGPLRSVIDPGSPYVQDEAVLVHRERLCEGEDLEEVGRHRECVVVLEGAGAVLERIADAAPRRGAHGRKKSSGTVNRSGVGDALEDADAVLDDAANPAADGFHGRVLHDAAPFPLRPLFPYAVSDFRDQAKFRLLGCFRNRIALPYRAEAALRR